MTCIKYRNKIYDTVLYVDAFNNEIIGYDFTVNHNSIAPYYKALNQVLTKIKGIEYQSILHSDQGIVYSSLAFKNAHKDYNIIRSMSRTGTPTDNPKMESINGGFKKEMYIDFDINNYNAVQDFIDDIVYDNNYLMPSYALNYKTPIEYKTQLGFK